MLCTSLCASAGMLMRFMSPSTRIIGGTPADRCRSDALFLTANAKSCAISTAMEAPRAPVASGKAASGRSGSITEGFRIQYVNGSAEFAGAPAKYSRAAGRGGGNRRTECRLHHTAGGEQGPAARACARRRGGRRAPLRRELPAGGPAEDGGPARSAGHLAFHRPPPDEQDAAGGGRLRMGAWRGSAEDRRASFPTAPSRSRTAQSVSAGQRRRREQQGRCARQRAAGTRRGGREAAAPEAARPDVHPAG